MTPGIVLEQTGGERETQSLHMAKIEAGKIYAIDGGFFKAHANEAREISLWTHAGYSGSVIGRTGFEIDGDGTLYHRVFDFETEEQILFRSAYTVEDLVEDDFPDEPPRDA